MAVFVLPGSKLKTLICEIGSSSSCNISASDFTAAF